MKPYYYIYNPHKKAPTVRHETPEKAAAEATRLAENHCGQSIEILMCIGIVSTPKPTATTFWMDDQKPTDAQPSW